MSRAGAGVSHLMLLIALIGLTVTPGIAQVAFPAPSLPPSQFVAAKPYYDWVGILLADPKTAQYLTPGNRMPTADANAVIGGVLGGQKLAIIPLWSGGSSGIRSVLVFRILGDYPNHVVYDSTIECGSLERAYFSPTALHLVTASYLPGGRLSSPSNALDTSYKWASGAFVRSSSRVAPSH